MEPGKHRREQEVPQEVTAAETKPTKKTPRNSTKNCLEQLRLEGPHQQEPNQEGKGESGDYSPGLADLIVNQIAEEQANIVTDPLLNGWQDAEGHEATDDAATAFASTAGPVRWRNRRHGRRPKGHRSRDALQRRTSAAATTTSTTCSISPPETVLVAWVWFRASPLPTPSTRANSSTSTEWSRPSACFAARASARPVLPAPHTPHSAGASATAPKPTGFAPDSAPCEAPWLSPCAGSIFHAYQYGGTYKVTLTVTDVAGDTAAVEHEVTVTGPPAPTPASGSTGSTGSSPGGSGGPGGSNVPGAGAAANVPAPVAAASIISKSPANALTRVSPSATRSTSRSRDASRSCSAARLRAS